MREYRRHDGGALSNGRRDAFSRAGPHVADGEHAAVELHGADLGTDAEVLGNQLMSW